MCDTSVTCTGCSHSLAGSVEMQSGPGVVSLFTLLIATRTSERSIEGGPSQARMFGLDTGSGERMKFV